MTTHDHVRPHAHTGDHTHDHDHTRATTQVRTCARGHLTRVGAQVARWGQEVSR